MAAQSGKDMLLKLDQTGSGSFLTVAGLRTRALAFNAAAIDTTDAESAGRWRDGFSPEVQAAWAASFGGLALCKGCVRGVQWTHWSDAEPHLYPHAGLVDAHGQVKPALQPLRRLRQEHLPVA